MKLGFIGCGNMASAMIGGIIQKGLASPEDIIASGRSETTAQRIAGLGIRQASNNRQVVMESQIIIIAVKPQYYQEVITEVQDLAAPEKIFVSIAPGKSLAWLASLFDRPVKLIRSMPNTPAQVGEGMSALTPNQLVSEEEAQMVSQIFQGFGKAELVTESLQDAVVGVSGSAPAYIFMLIEAMADAAVAEGMPRAQAYRFAAQAVLGSAKMVLDTGKHPGELKDMVCSPAGTTIEAVRILEEKGFRSAVMEAIRTCCDKGRSM